jgi:hypothetical protein
MFSSISGEFTEMNEEWYKSGHGEFDVYIYKVKAKHTTGNNCWSKFLGVGPRHYNDIIRT